VRKLVALVFNYSLNGLLAKPDTDFWKFCFELLDDHGGPDHDDETLEFLSSASAHVMGRDAYEGFAKSIPTSETNPWTPIMNAGKKVVFSTTLKTAEWENTTIASGDTREATDTLRAGGDGHIIVWGGVTMWRSLMQLDLIDEFRISMYPYITNNGRLLFEDTPEGYGLELNSAVPDSGGVIELNYRRRRTGVEGSH
jgi:dihydrofolate reductase